MANFKALNQGDFLWVDLYPTQGHEQQGRRPVLVVSNDAFNRKCGGMIKVVSITNTMRKFPLHIPLPSNLPVHGMVKLEQERAIDLSYRAFEHVCHVPDDFMQEVLKLVRFTY